MWLYWTSLGLIGLSVLLLIFYFIGVFGQTAQNNQGSDSSSSDGAARYSSTTTTASSVSSSHMEQRFHQSKDIALFQNNRAVIVYGTVVQVFQLQPWLFKHSVEVPVDYVFTHIQEANQKLDCVLLYLQHIHTDRAALQILDTSADPCTVSELSTPFGQRWVLSSKKRILGYREHSWYDISTHKKVAPGTTHTEFVKYTGRGLFWSTFPMTELNERTVLCCTAEGLCVWDTSICQQVDECKLDPDMTTPVVATVPPGRVYTETWLLHGQSVVDLQRRKSPTVTSILPNVCQILYLSSSSLAFCTRDLVRIIPVNG